MAEAHLYSGLFSYDAQSLDEMHIAMHAYNTCALGTWLNCSKESRIETCNVIHLFPLIIASARHRWWGAPHARERENWHT
jgi:hypothetical protein